MPSVLIIGITIRTHSAHQVIMRLWDLKNISLIQGHKIQTILLVMIY